MSRTELTVFQMPKFNKQIDDRLTTLVPQELYDFGSVAEMLTIQFNQLLICTALALQQLEGGLWIED